MPLGRQSTAAGPIRRPPACRPPREVKVHGEFTAADREFVQAQDMFDPATVDRHGPADLLVQGWRPRLCNDPRHVNPGVSRLRPQWDVPVDGQRFADGPHWPLVRRLRSAIRRRTVPDAQERSHIRLEPTRTPSHAIMSLRRRGSSATTFEASRPAFQAGRSPISSALNPPCVRSHTRRSSLPLSSAACSGVLPSCPIQFSCAPRCSRYSAIGR
jgi:hypothetical protein